MGWKNFILVFNSKKNIKELDTNTCVYIIIIMLTVIIIMGKIIIWVLKIWIVFFKPKKKSNHISLNSSLKSANIKSYKKKSGRKGLVSQITNNIISSSNFHSNHNIEYKRSFHSKCSSQYFNEQIEIKKISTNNKINSPSNLKNTFSIKSINTPIKDINLSFKNLICQNENNKNVKNESSISKVFNNSTINLRQTNQNKSNLNLLEIQKTFFLFQIILQKKIIKNLLLKTTLSQFQIEFFLGIVKIILIIKFKIIVKRIIIII